MPNLFFCLFSFCLNSFPHDFGFSDRLPPPPFVHFFRGSGSPWFFGFCLLVPRRWRRAGVGVVLGGGVPLPPRFCVPWVARLRGGGSPYVPAFLFASFGERGGERGRGTAASFSGGGFRPWGPFVPPVVVAPPFPPLSFSGFVRLSRHTLTFMRLNR